MTKKRKLQLLGGLCFFAAWVGGWCWAFVGPLPDGYNLMNFITALGLIIGGIVSLVSASDQR